MPFIALSVFAEYASIYVYMFSLFPSSVCLSVFIQNTLDSFVTRVLFRFVTVCLCATEVPEWISSLLRMPQNKRIPGDTIVASTERLRLHTMHTIHKWCRWFCELAQYIYIIHCAPAHDFVWLTEYLTVDERMSGVERASLPNAPNAKDEQINDMKNMWTHIVSKERCIFRCGRNALFCLAGWLAQFWFSFFAFTAILSICFHRSS